METACVIQPVHTTSNNERFPFEILGLIFRQYSLETISEELLKLETVLLVCKAWTLAALGDKTLWSRFAISLKHPESLRYWHHRVPLWVSRCSTTCLFDIEIISDAPYNCFNGQEQLLLNSIVRDLTGPYGEIARRWRSLGLRYFSGSFEPLVSFPTPNLIDLEIHAITSPVGHFLQTPILNRLRIEYSSCHYPNLESVTDLTIWAERMREFNEEALSKAQKLVRLSVYCNIPHSSLRGYFPLLEFLHLDCIPDKAFLRSFSAPQLKMLSLSDIDTRSYHWVSSCPGIQLGGLEELELNANQYIWEIDPDENCRYIDGVYLILNAATNIKELRTRSKAMVGFMLKTLGNPSNFRDHHFTLKYLEYTMELGQGEERLDRIAAFRSEALEEDRVGSDQEEEVRSDVDEG